MPVQNATRIDIFLASPSDVANERSLVETVIRQWNASRGRQLNVIFDLLCWEGQTVPDFGDYPQQVINQQIGSGYDLFIGIFWTRIGSPTPEHTSGTAEELARALERRANGERLHIALYFKCGQVDINAVDPEQLASLRDLKKNLANSGGFYREFNSDEELRSNLNMLLDRVSTDLSENSEQSHKEPRKLSSPTTRKLSKFADTPTETEIGLLDAFERLSIASDRLTTVLEQITVAHVNFNTNITALTAELTEINASGGDINRARDIFDRSAKELDYLTRAYNAGQSDIAENLREIGDMTRVISRIHAGYPDIIAGKQKTKSDLQDFEQVLSTSKTQIGIFIQTIDELPSFTTRIGIAKRQLKVAQEAFLSEMLSTHRVVKEAIEIL